MIDHDELLDIKLVAAEDPSSESPSGEKPAQRTELTGSVGADLASPPVAEPVPANNSSIDKGSATEAAQVTATSYSLQSIFLAVLLGFTILGCLYTQLSTGPVKIPRPDTQDAIEMPLSEPVAAPANPTPAEASTTTRDRSSSVVDFGPYMASINRELKARWVADPDHYASKSYDVILLFSVKNNGEIFGLKMAKSSGREVLDDVAIRAINRSKLKPLPPGAPDKIDVQFSFEYSCYSTDKDGKHEKI